MLYLTCLCASASVATHPAPATARSKWLTASVLGHVTSHTKHRPCFQGVTDIPSGRFPLVLDRDVGSNLEGISAEASDLLMRSFSALCLMCRPADLRQFSP